MNKIKTYLALLVLFFTVQISNAQTSTNWWNTPSTYTNPYTSTVNSSVWGTTSSSNTTENTVVIPTTNSQISQTQYQTTQATPIQNVSYTVQGDTNSNGIREDVDSVIASMVSQYSFNLSQKRAVEQLARSYEYALAFAPNSTQAAYQISIRDVAATNCAEQRLPSSLMDIVIQRIETSTLNTTQKRAIYDSYINLLDENTPGAAINASCEDEFSGTTTTNTNTGTNTGSVTSNNALPCLVLTQFMSPGSYGEQVTKFQTFLVLSGHMYVWPTGYFGPNTALALKSFQNKYGISSANPWAGPSTRSKVAEITCNGDQSAMSRARNGYTVSSYSSSKNTTSSYVESKTIEISTTTTTQIYNPNTYTNTTNSAVLSSSGGVFDTSKSVVGALYFTVKADTQRDDLYMCLQTQGSVSCNSSGAYTLVKSKYDPTSYDSIASGDRWIFNIYYNSNIWGNTGGNIYFKNGTGGVPVVYTVSVR